MRGTWVPAWTLRTAAWHHLLALDLAIAAFMAAPVLAQNPVPPAARWPVHSMERPRPPVVNPGPARTLVPPPSDAIVLFDGQDLAEWAGNDSAPAGWNVRGGSIECLPGTGNIHSRRTFGDVQLHIEWATPTPPHGEGQGPGNSGVYLMGYYEVQVLDSYRNDTYPDGQAAAIYGQTPPLVNASRRSGEWQTYDILFHRPRFNADGSVARPATITVLHNGVLVQDNTEITGRTVHAAVATYRPHADRLPIMLQDHGNRIRYRNIWVRELEM